MCTLTEVTYHPANQNLAFLWLLLVLSTVYFRQSANGMCLRLRLTEIQMFFMQIKDLIRVYSDFSYVLGECQSAPLFSGMNKHSDMSLFNRLLNHKFFQGSKNIRSDHEIFSTGQFLPVTAHTMSVLEGASHLRLGGKPLTHIIKHT